MEMENRSMIDLNRTRKVIDRYLKLYKPRPLKKEYIDAIEEKLNVILPEDFILITKYYDSYEMIGILDLFSFKYDVNDWNIVSQTLELREAVQLPKGYVILEKEGETFTAMLTKDNRSEATPVYWSGLNDVYNLVEEVPLENGPTIFPSFTDFFEYLVTEEENKRAEEKERGGA